ncbi:hypothetical protein [Helicobacter sp. 13S00477-4]|uniref:hypothetical protein n=1 Tax=Helicobacter sp. 13S00477-4 TaxID=1905759 RepID=UPI000BA7BB66|nr:hypothetical protein [Helicobacter sp. 13S00477-4]PAF50323.1 hypothetical protein BKH44_08495 [Helicobacter sp. 13S00477-4]
MGFFTQLNTMNIADNSYESYAYNRLKNAIDQQEKYFYHAFAWLFTCRIQRYRDRLYVGLLRDENLEVIRDSEKQHIQFLEDPQKATKFAGLNDDYLYQKLILDRLHPMYEEFILLLGAGDEVKGKDTLRRRMLKGEFVLSTEAVEYARAKMLMEIKSDFDFLRKKLAIDTEKMRKFDLSPPHHREIF